MTICWKRRWLLPVVFEEIRLQAEAEYSQAEDRNDSVSTTVWGRVSENVRKLALLYAISENYERRRRSAAP